MKPLQRTFASLFLKDWQEGGREKKKKRKAIAKLFALHVNAMKNKEGYTYVFFISN